jgi:hypothetical protein
MNIAERIREVDLLRKRISGVETAGWDYIKKVVTCHNYPKDFIFIKPLMPCTKMGYMVRGIVMAFEYDINNNKDVSQFYMNNFNPCVCDFKNFKSENKTPLSFITLQPTTILSIEKSAYHDLYLGVNNIEAISHGILYDARVHDHEFHSFKINMTNDEFILWFYNQHPILFNEKICERKFLSSYFGYSKDLITNALKRNNIIIL